MISARLFRTLVRDAVIHASSLTSSCGFRIELTKLCLGAGTGVRSVSVTAHHFMGVNCSLHSMLFHYFFICESFLFCFVL